MTLTRQNKEKEREKIMKKNLNKLATLALTGAIVAGMSFGSLAAGGSYTDGNGFLTKKVVTDGKTFAPNTTFTFEVTKVTDLTELNNFKGKLNKNDVNLDDKYLKTTTDDQADKVHLSRATFSAGSTLTDLKDVYEAASNLTFDDNISFSEPGIYVFGVKENTTNKYEGVKYDETQYYLLVSVTNTSDTNSTLKVSSVGLAKADGGKVSDITNYYGGKDGDDEEQGDVYDLTLKKVLEGLAVNHNETFKFDVTVTPKNTEGATENAAEKYAYYKVSTDGTESEGGVLTAGTETAGIELKENESIHIYGLSANDEVTIKEESNTYTATYTAEGIQAKDVNNDTALDAKGVSVKASRDAAKVTVKNTKNEITVTGVAMNIAPYAAMVLGAGAFAGIFLGMKKREDEE